MRRVWPIRNRDMIVSSCRDERFEEDHGVGVFLIERSLLRGCEHHMLCHDVLMNER